MGEDHGKWEDTKKHLLRIPRYRGSSMYEKCGSELERPCLSSKGKVIRIIEIEIVIMAGGSRYLYPGLLELIP